MTSHELAQRLLDGPDLPIGVWTYTGGDTALLSIKGAAICSYNNTNVLEVRADWDERLD